VQLKKKEAGAELLLLFFCAFMNQKPIMNDKLSF